MGSQSDALEKGPENRDRVYIYWVSTPAMALSGWTAGARLGKSATVKPLASCYRRYWQSTRPVIVHLRGLIVSVLQFAYINVSDNKVS